MAGGRGESAMTEQVLIVLHQEQSTPGRVALALRDRGYALDIRRPRCGDSLPATMDDHAGAVIFGGPQSANDPDDFIKAEIDFIGVPLRAGKPYLGICLGAQMLAKHLGERVAPHPEGKAEVGYYPVRPTAAGRAICDWPTHQYQWHREGFDLPRGVELLAEGDMFPIQAFRYRTAFAIQFHAEVTHAMMCRWTVRASERLALPGAQDRQRQIDGRYMHDPHVARWLDAFLDDWLGETAAAEDAPKRDSTDPEAVRRARSL